MNKSKPASIYKITCSVNNKEYIGATKQYPPEERFYRHTNQKQRNQQKNKLLYRAFNKYGIENFTFEVIYQSLDYKHILEMEPYFINLYETYWETGKGYNMTRGGEGIWGHKMSDESKKLMSIRQKKRFEDPIELERLRLQATGRKQSHQEKNKRSKSLKKYYETHDGPWTGKEFTKEHKANLSKARIGKSPTKETCSKISSSNSSKWEVTFPDNHKEIVKNLREFCRLNNLCTENLWKTSKGLIHKSEGFSAKKLLCDGFN